MNKLAKLVMEKYGWAIDIHDAIIVNPEVALFVRREYANLLQGIHSRRKTILTNYFSSIGIGAESQLAWERVQAKVQPLKGEFKCNLMALK